MDFNSTLVSFYGDQRRAHKKSVISGGAGFPWILILVQNNYTDKSVKNTEHKFTELEALN